MRQLLHVLLIFSNLSYSCDSNVLLHKFDYKLEERPAQAYNEQGEIVWSAEYDIYGKITKLKGDKTFVPFRQLGQYEDVETPDLYYNRFRYYDPSTGLYLSQDPLKYWGGG
ncbi:RHS repeat-associated core domain-containing protein [Flavobacterium oreochromis]|uniref:RHS repeat domain-containing protein n=1 Tax=Flavobacterium oreochromis TaxID=2906078 RepID=UPI003858934D